MFFIKLVEAVNRVAEAQESANKINRNFILHRIEQDKKSEESTKKHLEEQAVLNEKMLEQQEEMITIMRDNIKQAIEANNNQLVEYVANYVDMAISQLDINEEEIAKFVLKQLKEFTEKNTGDVHRDNLK